MTPVGSCPSTMTPPLPTAIPLRDYGADYEVMTEMDQTMPSCTRDFLLPEHCGVPCQQQCCCENNKSFIFTSCPPEYISVPSRLPVRNKQLMVVYANLSTFFLTIIILLWYRYCYSSLQSSCYQYHPPMDDGTCKDRIDTLGMCQ
jgi:hypothetical protein